MSQPKPVKIAVIGAGGIANNIHLPALKSIPGAHICAVCDILPERAQGAAERFGIEKTYTLYQHMLDTERPDAAFVLVQPEQSFRIALECLWRGINTFIEKPAGITSYQARTLERAAHQSNLICQIGFNRRHIPVVSHVVKRMREITRIEQVEGCFFKHGDAAFYDGCSSALMCDTIHAIDCIRWIADARPVKAATLIMRNDSPVDNAWNSLIKFDNGITGIIKANYNTGGRVHSFEIHGPKASAYIDVGFGGMSANARILHFGGRGTHSISAAGAGEIDIETIDGRQIAGRDEYFAYYGYLAEDEEFIECVRSGRKPLCDISEAVASMDMVEMIEAARF